MEQVTPIFLCSSTDETRAFYEALGFKVTYWQDEPYIYGAVSRGAITLNFTSRINSGFCLVHVPQVGDYHRAFADGLRAHYGRIPTADNPRITRLRKDQTRFHIYDPVGNILLFVNADEPDIDYEAYDNSSLSPLMRALENVAFTRDVYTDDKSAANYLDRKLKQHAAAPPIERALALAARAELAVALGDAERAQAVRDELAQLSLSDEERERYHDDLTAADALERWISTPPDAV